MANSFGSLYVGRSGLQSAQYALNATANNLANVDTKGYVREQVRFQDRNYLQVKDTRISINGQQSGLGVSIADVIHTRDMFLDKAYRAESGRQGFYETCSDAAEQMIDLFQELNGQEFKNSMAEFYKAIEELSKYPEDTTNQSLLIQKADLFNARCQSLYSDFQNYQSNVNDQIKDDVERINEIGASIYKLNLEVQKIENGGVETAMELRDKRDNLLDELSTYGAIDITEDMTGFVYVDFEEQRFVDDNRAYEIGLYEDRGTGFVTPYWSHLSDPKGSGELVQVFHIDVEIDPDYQNDMGKTKARLLSRGTRYGRYSDIDDTVNKVEDYNKLLKNRTIIETEAELDKLFNTMVTQMNDLLCPNEVCEDGKKVQLLNDQGTPTDQANLTISVEDLGGGRQRVTLSGADDGDLTYELEKGQTLQVLDVKNCSYGSDGELAPYELFTRSSMERYEKKDIQIGGKDFSFYIYNQENPDNVGSLYTIGNVQVNSILMKDYTKLPTYTDNPEELKQKGTTTPAVDIATAQKLVDLWGKSSEELYITPNDSYPCKYDEFYDKLISKLATDGNVYNSKAKTTEDSASSINTKRQQVTGVSSDEELTKMIKFQAAYNAASRYITVISQMTELVVTGLK